MDWQGWFSLALALAALLLMSSGRFAPHLVMMAVLVVLSVSGIISADQALAGFSNSGLITVVAMFVVAAGIHHSGGVDLLVSHLLRNPKSVRSAQARIALPVSLLSGFLNNTPVVATMIPAVHAWSRRIGISPSRLMIPLSYSAILGGTLTLIGTSTNLVVNGQYQQLTGEAGFSIFSITAVGLPVAIIGLAVMLLVMPWVLPDRKDQQKFGSMREFTLEVAVSSEGPLVGKTVGEAGLRELERLYLVEIERDGSVVTGGFLRKNDCVAEIDWCLRGILRRFPTCCVSMASCRQFTTTSPASARIVRSDGWWKQCCPRSRMCWG